MQYMRGLDGRYDVDPEEVCQSKKEWGLDEEATCISKFINQFEVTDVATDYIRSSEIQYWLEQNKMGISMVKFTMDLKEYASKNKLKNIVRGDKKISGKTHKVWYGIRKPVETYEDEDEEEEEQNRVHYSEETKN